MKFNEAQISYWMVQSLLAVPTNLIQRMGGVLSKTGSSGHNIYVDNES